MQKSKAGKCRLVLINVSVCLLTSHPIRKVSFPFAPLGVVLKMYEDTKWHNVISKKHFSVDMPMLYFDFLCRLYG